MTDTLYCILVQAYQSLQQRQAPIIRFQDSANGSIVLEVSGRARSRVVSFIYQGVVRVGVGVSLGLIYQQVS